MDRLKSMTCSKCKEDVLKILENLKLRYRKEETLREFMQLLQDADTFIEVTASERTNEKTNLPN